MHHRRGLLQVNAMLMQQDAYPFSTQRDLALRRQVVGQQAAGPQRLLQPVPARIVAHRLDQQPFVGFVPGRRPAVTPLGGQTSTPGGFKAVEPAMNGRLIHSQQGGDLRNRPAIGR